MWLWHGSNETGGEISKCLLCRELGWKEEHKRKKRGPVQVEKVQRNIIILCRYSPNREISSNFIYGGKLKKEALESAEKSNRLCLVR